MIENLALEASAGSGKTFALSVRYIALLFLDNKPNDILTLTFTNKAALEMKRRIFETLKNLENSDELKEICEISGKSKEEILFKKPEIVRNFLKSDLRISTIDSFFSSILRKFSFNIGLLPDFGLEESVVDDELKERFLSICKKEGLYDSLVHFSVNQTRKLVDIFSLFLAVFEKHSEIDFKSFATKNPPYPDTKRVLEVVFEIKDRFQKNGLGEKALKTLDISSVKELLEKKFLSRDDFSYWSYKKYADEKINSLHVELKKRLFEYSKAKERYVLSQIAKQYEAFYEALELESKQKSTLSFSLMTNRLFDMLRGGVTNDFIYFRLDGSFEHLLIDEFQDTSIVQYKILEPFMNEITSGVGTRGQRTLFLVGDTKQSIYRFRGGAKELFSYAAQSLNLKKGVLRVNYRSSSCVVDFINDTFEKKIRDYKRQEIKKDAPQGSVKVFIDDDIGKNLIKEIENLLNLGISQNDIALLCHTNQEALILKELIEDEISEVKASLEAKRKLIEIPVIDGIIEFLLYLYFKDELYLENFKTLCKREYKGESVFDLNSRVDELVVQIINFFSLADSKDDLLYFVEVCSNFRDIEEFLFSYGDISASSVSQDSEGIRVLTIHKSKGLEFSNLFVIDRLKRARSGGGTFIFDYDDISLRHIYLKTKNREFFDKEYREAKEKESQKESEDVLNTQYVAFTRARDNLFILAKEKSSAFSNLDLSELQKGSIYVKKQESKSPKAEDICYIPQKYGTQEVEKVEKESFEENFLAIEFGLALHYMLEIMGGFEPRFIDNAYESLKNRYKNILDVSHLEDIKKRVLRLVENIEFQELIKDAKLSFEQPLYYKDERKQLDLLIEKKSKVIVVDYKSSEVLQALHVKQVSLYKRALEEIYGFECEAYLCYLKKDDINLVKVR